VRGLGVRQRLADHAVAVHVDAAGAERARRQVDDEHHVVLSAQPRADPAAHLDQGQRLAHEIAAVRRVDLDVDALGPTRGRAEKSDERSGVR
jgi:hypothetical protein